MSMICDLYAVPSESVAVLRSDPAELRRVTGVLNGTERNLPLEKSWHGLHFALTGECWEGEPSLNFLLAEGTPVGEDFGYGPARLFDAAAVAEIHRALERFTDADFQRGFDLERMAAEEVYPAIWDEPRDELLEEYGSYLNVLRQGIRTAAEAGDAILVTLT